MLSSSISFLQFVIKFNQFAFLSLNKNEKLNYKTKEKKKRKKIPDDLAFSLVKFNFTVGDSQAIKYTGDLYNYYQSQDKPR